MNENLVKDLAITAEICGSEMSDAAARVVIAELEQYDPKAVHGALARCRRELSSKLTLAAIVARLDDGRPSPEEAWATLPKQESESAVLSDEMREAMGPALQIIAAGDLVAARMAFLEVYRDRVSKARALRLPVSWSVSLGHDPSGREAAVIDAIAKGRLTAAHGQALGIRSPETITKIEGPTVDARGHIATSVRKIGTPMASGYAPQTGLYAVDLIDALQEKMIDGRKLEMMRDKTRE